MSGNGKKGLWLALAISVFVVVVLGAAFFLFAPSKSAQTSPFDMKGKAEAKAENPSDYLEGQQGITGDTPATQTTTTNASGDIIILYGDQSASGGQTSGAQQTATPAPKTTQVTSPSATPSLSTQQTSSTGQSSSSGVKTQSPAVVSPPKTTTTAPEAAKTAPKTTTTTATAAPKATPPQESKPSSGSYWIQAGSFRTKSGADSLMGELQKKNIQAKISVKDIDGKSYYQVKAGPYASREDAKKWLKTVVAVPGVSPEAFVTQ